MVPVPFLAVIALSYGKALTFQTPALAAFDIEVDANSCFPELLLTVATVDVACRYCTLAIGGGNGGVIRGPFMAPFFTSKKSARPPPFRSDVTA